MATQRTQHDGRLRRFGYGDSTMAFLTTSPQQIIGSLTERSAFGVDQAQVHAWLGTVDALQRALMALPGRGHVFLEFDIPRLGRRVDAVVILDHVVFVVEFRVGAKEFVSIDVDQVVDYALDLKNFHEPSHHAPLVPVLVATQASARPLSVATDA